MSYVLFPPHGSLSSSCHCERFWSLERSPRQNAAPGLSTHKANSCEAVTGRRPWWTADSMAVRTVLEITCVFFLKFFFSSFFNWSIVDLQCCASLLYSKVTQLYIYIYIFNSRCPRCTFFSSWTQNVNREHKWAGLVHNILTWWIKWKMNCLKLTT